MSEYRLNCFTGNGISARQYEVDSPRTGLIMMDAVCSVWHGEMVTFKHELDYENMKAVVEAVKNEISLLPKDKSNLFPLINFEVFKNGEWEDWTDNEGNSIKDYEVENFDWDKNDSEPVGMM